MGCYGLSIEDAEGIDVGSGRLNTNGEMLVMKKNLLLMLVLIMTEGFSDWFLPF